MQAIFGADEGLLEIYTNNGTCRAYLEKITNANDALRAFGYRAKKWAPCTANDGAYESELERIPE